MDACYVASPIALKLFSSPWQVTTLSLSASIFLNSTFHPLIFGLPWLIEHNPQMNWATGEILAWSNKCALTCCSHSPASETPMELLASQPPEPASTPVSAEEDFPDLSNIPSCYLDRKEVFNMAKATSLGDNPTFLVPGWSGILLRG